MPQYSTTDRKPDASNAGLYPANTEYGDASLYPDTVEQVLVAPPGRDGYHDVYLIDGAGEIVAEGNRPTHRIEAALDGDEGYDCIVYEEFSA